MNSRGLLLAFFGIAACDCDDPSTTPPAACAEPGVDAAQPVLSCPLEIDLGCVPAAGAPASFDVGAVACDGTEVTTECLPSSGATFPPGVTEVSCVATGRTGLEDECEVRVRATESGRPSLRCPPAIEVACTGPLTQVDVGTATVDETCGDARGPVTVETSPEGFAVGAQRVAFSVNTDEGGVVSCGTEVLVTDDGAPEVLCDAAATVVRAASGPLSPELPTTSDLCDEAPDLVAIPASLDRGETAVTFRATDTAGNVGECETEFTVLDAFAPTDFHLVSATGTGDATHWTFAWSAGGGTDTTGFRLERSASPDGPWTTEMSVGVDERLAEATSESEDRAYFRVVALSEDLPGGATRAIAAHALAADEYTLTGETVPRVPFPTSIVGKVRYPRDLSLGPFPVTLLMHGNRGNCRSLTDGEDVCAPAATHACGVTGFETSPNDEGLLYLADTIAAQGAVAVSIGANAMNCRDTWIEQRAELFIAHLQRWLSWGDSSTGPFGGRFVGSVDLERAALLGHSRGGEGAARAAEILGEFPIDGVELASVLVLAPSDFEGPTTPASTPLAVMIGTCDGDVFDLLGARLYDRSIDERPRTEPHVQALLAGANHNFFNREWSTDDSDRAMICPRAARLTRQAQERAAESFVAQWLATTALESVELSPYFRAEEGPSEGAVAWAGSALDVRSSFAGEATVIANFSEPGAPGVNALDEASSFAGFSSTTLCGATGCGDPFVHQRPALELVWGDSATAVARFELGELDATGSRAVSLRVASLVDPANAGRTTQSFSVRVLDSGGGALVSAPVERVPIPHLYDAPRPVEVLQSVRILLPAGGPVAVERLSAVEVVPGDEAGAIAVTDVEVGD